MAVSSNGPQRVADTLFRRDMLGPTFGHMAGSVTGLLLIETLVMEFGLPSYTPALDALQASWGKTRFTMLGAIALGTIAYWIIGGLFAIPACLQVKQWKIQLNRSLDFRMLANSLPLVVFNFFTGIVVYVLAMLAFLPESAYDFSTLPSARTLARDIVVWLALQEMSFFYVHKFFHENKRAYALIHKLHHTWTAPISLVAIYCNPVEHMVANIGPLLIGPLLCGSHVASISVFLFAGLIHTTAVHSGYWICDDNGMHDEHHRKFNVNYGVTGLMDSWYGTYQLPPGAVGAQSVSSTEVKKE